MNNKPYRLRSTRFLIRPIHPCATLALALIGPIAPAYAQIAGGGGNAGALSQVINWVATNIDTGGEFMRRRGATLIRGGTVACNNDSRQTQL